MIRVLITAIYLLCAPYAWAAEITGPAKAVDSTTIEIAGQRLMLFGIDSVMRKQTCTIDGKVWQCWRAAIRNLETLLDQGPAVCQTIGDADVYGRLLARCTINGQSLNEQLISTGYAVARRNETTEYVAAEAAAKEKKVGLWQGQFLGPSEFRRAVGIFVDRP